MADLRIYEVGEEPEAWRVEGCLAVVWRDGEMLAGTWRNPLAMDGVVRLPGRWVVWAESGHPRPPTHVLVLGCLEDAQALIAAARREAFTRGFAAAEDNVGQYGLEAALEVDEEIG